MSNTYANTDQPATPAEGEGLPFGLIALPLAIAGHVQQPNRRFIEVTDDVRRKLAESEARLTRASEV